MGSTPTGSIMIQVLDRPKQQHVKPITLRSYQQEAVDAVYEHLRSRDDNPCVVIPTGGGKTPCMATICHDAVKRWNGRVLVLAHVKELLDQTATTLSRIAPDLDIQRDCAGVTQPMTSSLLAFKVCMRTRVSWMVLISS